MTIINNDCRISAQELGVLFDEVAEEIFQDFADTWYGDWISDREDGVAKELTIVPFFHMYRKRYTIEPSLALYLPFYHLDWKILLKPYKELEL